MPKLVGEDLQLFLGIMSDLFPGAELPEPSYGTLQVAIEVYFSLPFLFILQSYAILYE
jgi:hypothetical protein